MKRLSKIILLATLAITLLFPFNAVAAQAGSDSSLSKKQENILNVAHRGASGFAPEHTMLSYSLGQWMQGDYIEIDLQMTKDGELIAFHDETLDRTTNGSGLVKDYTLAEIKELDAGSWFNEEYPQKAFPLFKGLTVPTLDEVLTRFGKRANYYIETKSPEVYPGMEEKLLETLEQHGLIGKKARENQVLIQSFSQESLQKVHRLNPDVSLVQLLWYTEPATITAAELQEIKRYAIGIGMNHDLVDQKYIQSARDHDLLVHPYTVNKKKDMRKMLDWGATGMFTNYPNRLHEVIQERK
ncbi:glycerophosphodiester phosphodiesterase [Mechercharimyces sp. CAU 1602]|uniref:glycerophosphodiester phosphodiesterase n=1 Tax=Mechercharimyces sp. CAU 1602 TaxID=2973933 RepID=UPI002162C504|nr:glycerophosphodiester phosphodiesterase [Mechercharimyces sp. CAU 1602]MCS1352407.1 glycerophosphodiester phosphodiesterase [Mechercharimyces sp. CAU 1602]